MTTLTAKQQLDQLKALTVRFGVLHEIQIKQLKFWPLLISKSIKSAEIKVVTDDKSVKFLCSGVNFKKSKQTDLICTHIVEWVRELLWNDTSIEILVNDKFLYRSEDAKPQ